jgi:uncharacterized membrane protein
MESVFIGPRNSPTMRPAPRLTALLVVVALLFAGIAPAPATADDPRVRAVGGPDAARLDAPANTTIEVTLYGNASADLRVTTTYVLESDEERAAFADYAAGYRAGETDAGPRPDPFVAAAARASAATGREMRIENVTRAGGVDGATGTVSVGFRWTNFLTPTGNDTLVLEEALRVGGDSTWLGSLTVGQTLVLKTPPGYSIVDSEGPSFEIRDNAVRFEGPREFDERLTVTYRRTGPATPDPPPEQGLPWGVLGGGAVVLALAAAAAYVRRGRDDDGAPAPDGSPGDGGGGPAAGAEAGPEPDAGAEPETEAEVDPELLSDGERVERLLERNDGRMKQAAIVDETGWSDAKVSQLLSSMADENRIEKLRLGRENLISLPDDEE